MALHPLFFCIIFYFQVKLLMGDNMVNKRYEEIVAKNKPKEDKFKYALTAFFVGGLLGVLGETLIRVYIYFFNKKIYYF